jgi:GNAT superfamily N-acetyltransferase
MTAAVTVHKVGTKAEFETFLRFPWTLYRGDPNWVPPLVSMQRHKLDRQKNSSWEHMTGEYFIARRGGEPVGTIAAFINHRHNEFHDERIGFFGCFEVRDDQQAADALLQTAADYVQGQGYNAIRGPATFSTNEECGILVEGFDGPPIVLYPYNPPYYQRLLESAPGFQGVMDLFAYRFTLQETHRSDRLQKLYRIIHRNNERRGITVRPPDTRHLAREFATLKAIYNDAWERNWGFVPFTDTELDELVDDLGMFFDPRITLFAEVKGKPVGFLLGLPDMNQALHAARPHPRKPDLWTKLQVLWHWKIRSKITRLRIPLMGVMAQYRGIGVEAAMFADLFQRGVTLMDEAGWQYVDGGWVLATNEPMIRLCETHNGTLYRRFRFYERALSPGRSG